MNHIDSSHITPCGPASARHGREARDFNADSLVRRFVQDGLGKFAGGHGRSASIQTIAASIRKVLSKSEVAGTDAPDDILRTVEKSLKKAAQALADRGVDAKTIDETIDRFRSQLADALDKTPAASDAEPVPSNPVPSAPPPAKPSPESSVEGFVAREVRKQRGAIDILTAEGDRVSIRFRSREVATVGGKQETGADGTVTTTMGATLISRGRLSIEVKGDLNEAELAAIGDLLGKVDEIATKFFSGDVQAAFAAAADLGVESDEIAAYRLDLTYSRKTAAAAWGRAGSTVASPSVPGAPAVPTASGVPAASAAPGAPSVPTGPNAPSVAAAPATAAPTASTAAAAATGAAKSEPAADALPAAAAPATNGPAADAEATEEPKAPAAPPASVQKTLTDFIGDALSKLGSAQGAGRFTFSMKWKVQVLVTALDTMTPRKDSATPAGKAMDLAGEALEKAAAV